MKTIKTAYGITTPSVGENPVNFTFPAVVAGNRYEYTFRWYDNIWHLWVTFPSGEIRQALVTPGSVAWTSFIDWGLAIVTSLLSIGQNDLSKVQFVMVEWDT